MKIARKPLTEKEETEGRIEWLTDLKETILEKRLDDAVDNINAAIKLLEARHGASMETSGTSRP